MKKFDMKDRRLLYEIDLNARLGTSALAKRVGLSQEGVHYRLKRLEQRGVITKYMTMLNFSLFGYTGHAIYARFQNVTGEEKAQIFQELQQHEHVYWIAEFGGKFDLAFGIMATSIIHFNQMLSQLQDKYSNVLKDMTVAIRVELVQFPKQYLLKEEVKEAKKPHFGKRLERMELDHLNRSILKHVATDARLPVLQLAKEIKKPTSTVSSRLKEMEKEGIIQGYAAHIHCQQLGYQSFQLFLSTQNMTAERRRKLATYCEQHPNIIFLIETVGAWNFEVIFEVENQRHFQELVTAFRTEFAEILTDVESIVLFNHYVKYDQYPMPVE